MAWADGSTTTRTQEQQELLDRAYTDAQRDALMLLFDIDGRKVSQAPENTGVAAATIQAEIDALPITGHQKGGAIELPSGSFNVERPLIGKDNVVVRGLGGRGTTILNCTAAFPSMTLNNGGTLTLPAATIPVSARAGSAGISNMPTTGGIIRMVSSNGIQNVFYTGISGSSFTGCTGGTGTVANGSVIGTPVLWGGHPILDTAGAYGCRFESLYVECSSIPGIGGYYTNRAQEQSGLRDMLFRNYMYHGVDLDAVSPSGQITQNLLPRGLTLAPSASATEVGMTSLRCNGLGTTFRGADDITFASVGLTALPNAIAIALIGASGLYGRFNLEQHGTGILIDNATSPNRGVSIGGAIGYGGALVDLIKITASSGNCSISLAGLSKLSAGSANLVNDLMNSIAFADNSVGLYVAGQPNAAGARSVITDAPGVINRLMAGLQIGGPASVGGGVGVLGMKNAATVPSTNPSAGGVLYVESGALKYRGSGGTVTVLGPA